MRRRTETYNDGTTYVYYEQDAEPATGLWYRDSEQPYQYRYNEYGEPVGDDPEAGRYDTDISISGMGYYNEDIYRDYLSDFIDMVDDCDIDCQQRGSQLTMIAVLMQTLFGLISLNALFMFIGTWRYRWRICSIYCTMCMCIF